jgi:hypothetical protein
MREYSFSQGLNKLFNHERRKTMKDILREMEEDFEANASAVETVEDNGLKSIAQVARLVRDKEDQVRILEEQLKEVKRQLLKLSDEDLPALLQEVGVNSFTLDDGSKVEVKTTYGAHIKAENKQAAFEWLRSEGYDDIIKNIVSCQFGRGEDNNASDFFDFALKSGFNPDQKTDVHPQTLKAFVRERVETGDEFPMELFGAYVGQRATIKRSK